MGGDHHELKVVSHEKKVQDFKCISRPKQPDEVCVYFIRARARSGREERGIIMAIEKTKRKANSDVRRKRKKIEKTKNEASESEQLRFFQSAMGLQLSSLELESLKDRCILELSEDADSDVKILGKNIKAAFGASWKEVLCEEKLVEGKVNAGSPAVLIITSSALRCIHLLRGFRSITKECHAAKLFSKHMKLEEQISLLKNRVNIASGTPSRIKKLIDAEALDLSRLQVLVLDMHPDVKGYSLFTLPQVRDEFWDLFKNYFYQPMIQGDLRICLYGYQVAVRLKGKQKQGHTIPDT
ncbi:CMSS1 protein [Spatholobus suberectus]|nr:CMSS1 protein [Spatholobus suberectus]